jgi:RNA polymerase sigma-70 factor (ECF subfamily)
LHSAPQEDLDPERLAQAAENRQRLHQALDELPTEYREILVLRELVRVAFRQTRFQATGSTGTG